jgi:bifunctional ADP-heptose synthase (sugar kinase/adenylyltransferase)
MAVNPSFLVHAVRLRVMFVTTNETGLYMLAHEHELIWYPARAKIVELCTHRGENYISMYGHSRFYSYAISEG